MPPVRRIRESDIRIAGSDLAQLAEACRDDAGAEGAGAANAAEAARCIASAAGWGEPINAG
jgi:hypothetical protein